MSQLRMILAVLLSMVVFFIYYTYIEPPVSKVASPQASQSTNDQSVVKSVEKVIPADTLPAAELKNGFFPNQNQKGEQWNLENDQVKLIVDSFGGRIDSVYLKSYPEGEKNDVVNLVDQGGGLGGLSFTSSINDFGVSYVLNKAESSKTQLVLEGQLDAFSIKKIYRMDALSVYGFEQEFIIENKSNMALDIEPQFWMSRHQKEAEHDAGMFSFLSGPPDLVHPLGLVAGKVLTETDPKKLGNFGPLMGDVAWSGFGDRYFLASFISRQSSQNSLVRFLSPDGQRLYATFTYGSLGLGVGETLNRKIGFYLGPKLRSVLQGYGVGLEKSVDYGWFSFVAVPLLWFLVTIQKVVGNWGISIIVLTFIVKLLLHPVNKKSMQSMKAMQKLQPKMKELQTKYKNDREKLNLEMMALFKSHSVNPMGGCLPMLMQMPIYISLYKVLWNAIELYRVPFFGIYKDLSAPDPYFIAPIVLGILFFLQQKLTPTSASMDPAQAKVMQFMPLMFTAFMIFLPAGLLLYIIVNTLMSVIQQYMIHRDLSFMDLLTGKRAI